MKKIRLIIEREYLTRVKKKSFLLTTILVPVVIIGFYAAIIAIAVSGGNETESVAVIDKAGLFDGKIENPGGLIFTLIDNETENSFKEKYSAQGYRLFLAVPQMDINNPTPPNLYYEKSVGPVAQAKIESIINKAIERKKLLAANIDAEKLKTIRSNVEVITYKGSGEKSASVASVNSGVGFTAGFLIYIVLFIYGSMVMRGVMEEKTSRIAEVIISSVKPFQLMLGKILGIGAVGLTQFFIWIALIMGLQLLLPYIFPEIAQQLTQASGAGGIQGGGGMLGIMGGLRALPVGMILFAFIFYFVGGYLLYAALFAAVGSVVNEDPQEAQQLMLPIMMPIILAFVIMTQAINQPDSSLSIFGSLFPLTSPIVMMGRIPYGVPLWQLVASMSFLIIGFLCTTWLAAKIYRTGILLYGKKVTFKEMIKWTFRKS